MTAIAKALLTVMKLLIVPEGIEIRMNFAPVVALTPF